MFSLISAILIIAMATTCAYVAHDISSKPLKSISMASKYKELSDQILKMIRCNATDLPRIMPLLLEWANLDVAIRNQESDLRNQVLAMLLIHNYPFESNRVEISNFIKSVSAPGKVANRREPVPERKDSAPPEGNSSRLGHGQRPEAAVFH